MKRILFLILAFALAFSLPANAVISTLQSTTIQYGNNSQNLFYGAFPIVSASDVSVIYTNTSGQQTTLTPSQYLVTIFPPVTGQIWSTSFSITYPLIGSPIAAGTSLTISRVLPLLQSTVLSNQGAFYPKVVESALDTNVMQLQQVSARTGQLRGSWITSTYYNFGDIVVDGIGGNNTGNLYVAALSNLSGTWKTDLANGDWVIGLNVQGIINTNPAIGNNFLFGNISGGSLSPYGVSASAFFDSAFGNAQGEVLYRSGSTWTALPHGSSGQFLTSNGASANPSWTTAVGTGTVTSVGTGTGLTGGPITGSGTISLASVADATVMANTSGSSMAPTSTTLSAILDYILGSTQGDVIYRAGSVWSALAPGSSGQVLTTGGSAANPSWTSKGFGAWTINGYSITTVYQAATDGFVTAYNANAAGSPQANLTGITDSSASPGTVVIQSQVSPSGGVYVGIMFPVRKGDYWKVTGANISTAVISWLPLGN